MGLLRQLNEWSDKHHPKWMVVLRAALGLSLLIKGITFIQNTTVLQQLISQTPVGQNVLWLGNVIPWLHLLGGTMIFIGLFTRIAVLLQIPILIGAVFFVNVKQGLFAGGSDLLFSIIILLLLLFFLVEGGGFFSMDDFLRSKKEL